MLIKDNPIKDETQKKIEKVLLDYSYISLYNKSVNKPFDGIDSSVINPKLSRFLFESKEPLIKTIVKFKQELRPSKHIKSNQMDLVLIEAANIIAEMGN